MGKGFRLKGHTGVKECLAFQTPNPLSLSAQSETAASATRHMNAHAHINMVHLSHTLNLCTPSRQQAQVVVIDWMKRLKINVCLAPCSPSSVAYVEKASALGALSSQIPDLPLIHPPPTGPSSFPHAETLECRGCG